MYYTDVEYRPEEQAALTEVAFTRCRGRLQIRVWRVPILLFRQTSSAPGTRCLCGGF